MYITERLTVNNVTGTSVAGGTATIFDTDLPGADDIYNGMTLEFTSGPCKGQQGIIFDFKDADGEITLTAALTRVPGADSFIIWTETDVLGAVNFDLPITGRFCKIVYIGIIQLTSGPMQMNFEIWESTGARSAPDARTNFYQKILNRRITMTQVQGGEYGESLAGDPMPYFDRDAVDEERTYRLHCRIENDITDGTASDFAVTIKIADMGENA